jgi:hypothetical protein
MIDRTLAGRCGLFCGACDILRADRDGGELRGRLADHFGVEPDKVRCNGCGDLKTDSWGTGCKILNCLNAKGYIFCFECDKYRDNSCEIYEELAGRYLEDGYDVRQSLKRIADGGIDKWLEESEKRFACRSCGKPVIAGAEKCHHCEARIGVD